MAAQKKKKRHINLLPKDDFDQSTSGRVLRWTLTTFRMIVIVVELIVISGFLSRFWLDLNNSDLSDEIEQKQNLILSYQTFEQDFRSVQSKLRDYNLITEQKNYSVDYFTEIANRVPTDVALESVTKDGDILKVEARSITELSIAQFAANLRTVSDFESISLKSIEAAERETFLKFSLEIKLS